jgi:TetR/AcrR family transcriptional regulator
MRQTGKSGPSISRDPERTRRRILRAALAEFSAKGFAGARVDAIARRARGNKRMLYHYFGNKEALFSAVLRYKMAERRSRAETLSKDPADRLPFWFASACADSEWVRLLEWEALQMGGGKLIDEKERRSAANYWLEQVRDRQRHGLLSSAFDASHLALAMQSLTLFPSAFPQLVRLNTGKTVNDAGFQKEYAAFLTRLSAMLKPQKSAAAKPIR